MRVLSVVCAFALGLFIYQRSAQATFHLWQVQELYSSPDGSLQYVELHNLFTFENLIAGHEIIASGGGPDRTFTFPSNLSTTATANKSLLIATSNFESITGVMPDFTLPDNFLSLSGGTALFDGSGSSLSYAAGAFVDFQAVGPGGVSQEPSPTNFAGETAVIIPEPSATILLGLGILSFTLCSRCR